MLHVSTQKLIQKLCALTQAGDIAWQEGAGNSEVIETEGYRVEAESDPPSIRVLRNDGKELEGASAADLEAARWPDEDATYATHVADMVRRARRIARGAEQAISKILSSLSAPPQKAPAPVHQFVVLTEPEPPPSPHTLVKPSGTSAQAPVPWGSSGCWPGRGTRTRWNQTPPAPPAPAPLSELVGWSS